MSNQRTFGKLKGRSGNRMVSRSNHLFGIQSLAELFSYETDKMQLH